ncbi:uncharacterized protein K452DRAFT_325823 [Aplosporella prunicola CBS 121167]|uniref:Acyl-protein thioesterase 1 n=1 Tax=Aplosporella prunicola CBS 121167 TaxID=1176127 RepID=A0A6A6BIE0_9PEZI|nr:uncharacterized protein K452DRAFT_325823 [Aplosporella prunicola CBS 121167]KAF2143193.1 hypothetical protein K452DRAFT_325823 [Aplosporella prunicola CBS 121167]
MSKTKRKQTVWPDPLVINPTSGTHTHSIILLHGRGSNASRFGLELLKARTSATGTPTPGSNSDSKTLAQHFPSAKFIFPTAKKRRSTTMKRIPINQWFDNTSLTDPSQRPELQYDGLRETSAFVHVLIEKEAALVGVQNVVVGGLSQGCAAALHVLLNYHCQNKGALAGFVGMSGWLPFAGALDPRGEEEEAAGDGEEDEDDIFGADDDEEGDFGASEDAVGRQPSTLEGLQLRAANTARDIASLPPLSAQDTPAFPRTPVFLGHGRSDEKVAVELGEQARDVLGSLGCSVRWEAYDEGHWYKVPDEIDDIVDFLETVVGIQKA